MNIFPDSTAEFSLFDRKSAKWRRSLGIALVTAISFSLVTTAEAASNKKPKAVPGKAQTVNEQTAVTLDGSGSSDPDGSIASYLWEQIAGPAVTLSGSHAATAGFTAPLAKKAVTLSFKLTVTDNAAAVASKTVKVKVKPVNARPVANAGSNQSVGLNATVTLNGSGSSDQDGQIVQYLWKQTAGTKVKLSDAKAFSPSFTSLAALKRGVTAESLQFQLTVTDDEKAKDVSDPVTVTVNANPAAVLQAALNLDSNNVPAGEILTATAQITGGTSPFNTAIAWGDGASSSSSPATHTYATQGTYSVVLTVSDSTAQSTTISKSVTVTAPVLKASLSLDKSTVAKGETLTASAGATGGKPAYGYSIDWGDGSTASAASSATHSYSQSGNYTVTVTVTDADGTHKTASQNLVVSVDPLTSKFDLNGRTPVIVEGDTLTARAYDIAGGDGPYKVKFDWGDGSTAEEFTLGAGTVLKSASHPYATLGQYTLTITVTDAGNRVKTYSITVDVQALNPLGQC